MDERCRTKLTYDELLGDENGKNKKVTRQEVDIPTAEVDIRLAEKLDSLLKIGDSRKPKFLTNKPKHSSEEHNSTGNISSVSSLVSQSSKLKQRHLSKKELRDRVAKKYDVLVPEFDFGRKNVRVVKILSASESIELGRNQARKQMERQLELNSVSGNQLAQLDGYQTFRFNDGYEMSTKSSRLGHGCHSHLPSKISSKLVDRGQTEGGQTTKTVRFSHSNPTDEDADDDDDNKLTDESDESSLSD